MFFPKRLVFSGGGTRCLVFLPTLLELEKKQQLIKVKQWWGTSAGSLLASLLALTQSVQRVNEIMKETNFARFRDVNIMNIMELTTTWGLDDCQSMVREVERVLELAKAGSSQYKMKDIQNVSIFVCDLNQHKTLQCSAETYPDMRLVDVIRASMTLPFFYTPFRNPVNNHVWVDGAVDAHFPWKFLITEEAKMESLGFAFERSWIKGPKTFSEFVFSILHFGEPEYIFHLKSKWSKNIIWFPSPPFPAWYFSLKSDDFTLLEQMSTAAYQMWLTACSSGKKECPLQSEVPRTPPSETRQDCKDGKLGIQKYSFLPQQPYPSRDSQPQTRRLFRRWSV